VIDAMAAHGQVLPYLDIPLQHSNDAVLRRMRRPSDVDAVRRALTVMRQRIGGLALRTTFIVGFPGETEAEFQALLEFLEDVRFDHVGAFQYSPEAGTAAAEMADDIAAEVKQERWDRLMARQQAVSLAANQAWIGRALDVLVEGANDGVSLGRSYRDAPEVDGLVIIEGELPVGRLARVHVTGAMAYDLTAVSSSAAASGPS
jgi:ribosomal protein S12 methylthiotransferase